MRSGGLWHRIWRYAKRTRRSARTLCGGFQRSAVYREVGHAVADDAARSAALAGGLSPDAALDTGRLFRDDRGRPGFAVAPVGWAQRQADGHDPRQPHLAVDAGVGGARRIRRGAKRRKGSKVHAAVDTLGHLLALHVTAADEQDRAQVERLAAQVQRITQENVELAYVDQGYTGEAAAEAADQHGIQLVVVKHTQAKRGFVLLPRRWVAEKSFA